MSKRSFTIKATIVLILLLVFTTLVSVDAFFYHNKANGVILENKTIERINRTETMNISFGWMPIRAGNYTLSAVVDPQDHIFESNETNKNVTMNVTVEEFTIINVSPDYSVIQEAIDAAPPGSTINIKDGE